MLECLILGDSIAKGIAQQRPACVQSAQVGVTSEHFKYETINRPELFKQDYKIVVISLGTNDGKLVHSFTYLALLRDQINASKVMWILPQPQFVDARNAVKMVADLHHDSVIEVPVKYLSHDKIHPTAQGYKDLAHRALD
jgi:hypothetical protein